MKKLPLAKCLEKRYKKMEIAFKKVTQDFDESAIHSFRREVKKIGSLLQLANASRSQSSKSFILHILDSFYKRIGIMRSLQLQTAKVKELDFIKYPMLPSVYLLFLQQSVGEVKESLVKTIAKRNPFETEKKKLFHKLPRTTGRKTVQKFVDERIVRMSRLYQMASFSDKSLHMIRKILKDILVIASETKNFTGVLSDVSFGRKAIKSLTQVLGKFHDQCVSLDLLHQHYKEQSINEGEREAWLHLYNDWWDEKERNRMKLESIFQKIFPHLLASMPLLDKHDVALLSQWVETD